jgi:hypothetical protein
VTTSATPATDPALPRLVHALRAHGLLAEVRILSVCGEPDVRLVSCREDGEVVVELLAAFAVELPGDRWSAVRVRGEDRQVWQGPPHDAPPGEVVAFVEALLDETGRVPYPCLG